MDVGRQTRLGMSSPRRSERTGRTPLIASYERRSRPPSGSAMEPWQSRATRRSVAPLDATHGESRRWPSTRESPSTPSRQAGGPHRRRTDHGSTVARRLPAVGRTARRQPLSALAPIASARQRYASLPSRPPSSALRERRRLCSWNKPSLARDEPWTRGMECGRGCSCVQPRVQPAANSRWPSQTWPES
jgi:hypothetical protein